jgi:hypothetical protein
VNFAAIFGEFKDITRGNSRIGDQCESDVKSLSSFWFGGLEHSVNCDFGALKAHQKHRDDDARDERGSHDEEFLQSKKATDRDGEETTNDEGRLLP